MRKSESKIRLHLKRKQIKIRATSSKFYNLKLINRYFWKFMADNETFLVPHDHENFEGGAIDRQLLFDLINGRQNKVLDFDYSAKEEQYEFL